MGLELFWIGFFMGSVPFLLAWLGQRKRVQHLENLILGYLAGEARLDGEGSKIKRMRGG